jgi:predicted transcriptional regulator
MSYSVAQLQQSKTNAYKALLNQLQTENGRTAALEALTEICATCRPVSPLMCVELCEIWSLKQQYHDALETLHKGPVDPQLLNAMKNRPRRLILQRLMDQPQTVTEIQAHLKTYGYISSLQTLRDTYLHPLIRSGLARVQDSTYRITGLGQSLYTIFISSDLAELPIHSHGYEERVLLALHSGAKTRDDLVQLVPRHVLPRVLRRLHRRHFIAHERRPGRVFYYATKRRATRAMTPTEAKIFKALTKDALSPREISATIDISVRRVYKFLRRLWFKQHISKETKQPSISLTAKGCRLAKSLMAISDLAR